MEIKRTDPVTVLSAERMSTLADIASLSAELCPALTQDAERHGLVANGPWIFVSYNLPKDGQSPFRIEFCLPVSANSAYQGRYALKTLRSIDCAAAHHKGPLQTLFSEGYGPLLQEISTAGHELSGESREVYHRWSGPDGADNRIEIQFGLR